MIDDGIGASSKEQSTINSKVNRNSMNKLFENNIKLHISNFSDIDNDLFGKVFLMIVKPFLLIFVR